MTAGVPNRITLFTAPKPFAGHIGVIQRNALRSWAALRPSVDILVLGDEAGLPEAAAEIGARHLAGVARNASGTPLLSDIFRRAEAEAVTPWMAYLNADVMLVDDFLPAVARVAGAFDDFIIVGQRWDLAVPGELRFDNAGKQALKDRLGTEGRRHAPSGSDYFVFPRGRLGRLPEFALGRAGWDNWMIFAARHAGRPVVDASEAVTAIHQDHDYAHLPGGQPHYRLPESRENTRLGGGLETIFTLRDADWELTCENLHKLGWRRSGIRRWAEAGLISLVGSGRGAQAIRLGMHPVRTVRYFAERLNLPGANPTAGRADGTGEQGSKRPPW